MRSSMDETPGRVVVAGSINVDLIVGVARLPRPGETVLGGRLVQQNGGKSANQAMAASRVGARVTMLGAVGDDDLGRRALAGLEGAGVDISACRVLPGEHTGVALIIVDTDAENQIAVASGANARVDAAMMEAETSGLEVDSEAVCLLGFEIGDSAVLAAARWAAARGWRVIVNPAPARAVLDELYAVGPILTPNEREAAMLTGEADPALAAAALAERSGAPAVVTLGARGAVLALDGSIVHLPALAVEPVDTTGAGDALNGILAAELARGADLPEALRWAIAGASLKTTRAGAQAGLPTRDAIAAHLG
jgi:ribokinase